MPQRISRQRQTASPWWSQHGSTGRPRPVSWAQVQTRLSGLTFYLGRPEPNNLVSRDLRTWQYFTKSSPRAILHQPHVQPTLCLLYHEQSSLAHNCMVIGFSNDSMVAVNSLTPVALSKLCESAPQTFPFMKSKVCELVAFTEDVQGGRLRSSPGTVAGVTAHTFKRRPQYTNRTQQN